MENVLYTVSHKLLINLAFPKIKIIVKKKKKNACSITLAHLLNAYVRKNCLTFWEDKNWRN